MKKSTIQPKKIIKSVLLSYVITLILTGILAVVVSFGEFKESTACMLVFALMIVSVLIGAFILAKNVDRAGLLNGFLMAVGYLSVILIISFFISGKIGINTNLITRAVTISSAGMLGGILGINT